MAHPPQQLTSRSGHSMSLSLLPIRLTTEATQCPFPTRTTVYQETSLPLAELQLSLPKQLEREKRSPRPESPLQEQTLLITRLMQPPPTPQTSHFGLLY